MIIRRIEPIGTLEKLEKKDKKNRFDFYIRIITNYYNSYV